MRDVRIARVGTGQDHLQRGICAGKKFLKKVLYKAKLDLQYAPSYQNYMQKKQYSEPTLEVFGKVEELTLANSTGPKSDTGLGQPIPATGGRMS